MRFGPWQAKKVPGRPPECAKEVKYGPIRIGQAGKGYKLGIFPFLRQNCQGIIAHKEKKDGLDL